MKIGQHFAKLWARVGCPVFYAHLVYKRLLENSLVRTDGLQSSVHSHRVQALGPISLFVCLYVFHHDKSTGIEALYQFDDIHNRFDTTPALNRRMDGQTDGNAISISRCHRRAITNGDNGRRKRKFCTPVITPLLSVLPSEFL